MLQLHSDGGDVFMYVIDLAALINLSIIGYLIYTYRSKKTMNEKLLQTIKQVGGFALAWGAASTLLGLFEAFRWLEQAKEMVSFNIFYGGMRVALICTLYGLAVYLISQMAFILLTIAKKN
ncbi:MAG: MotA/TolQ/ExbB proton channel family protein [Bacteroidetes bacterium]|nr:MotA/TolQ/ExbB proton channel family protein [Bacteroidota bacterium]